MTYPRDNQISKKEKFITKEEFLSILEEEGISSPEFREKIFQDGKTKLPSGKWTPIGVFMNEDALRSASCFIAKILTIGEPAKEVPEKKPATPFLKED